MSDLITAAVWSRFLVDVTSAVAKHVDMPHVDCEDDCPHGGDERLALLAIRMEVRPLAEQLIERLASLNTDA